MPIWSGNVASFGGVYTQSDSRLAFFWTARLTLAADGQAVTGRISWHRGAGPVAASNYIGTHVAYRGDEVVAGEYVAAAGPSALPQITLRGTSVSPGSQLGCDEYIWQFAADGSTVTVLSKGGQMPGEQSGCGLPRCPAARCRQGQSRALAQKCVTYPHPTSFHYFHHPRRVGE
jgi:hypothetical protein